MLESAARKPRKIAVPPSSWIPMSNVNRKVAYSRDPTQLRSLTGDKGPRHLVFALGYAGWAPGQLESEIRRGGWYVIDWDESLVFGTDHAKKWQRAVALHAPEL